MRYLGQFAYLFNIPPGDHPGGIDSLTAEDFDELAEFADSYMRELERGR